MALRPADSCHFITMVAILCVCVLENPFQAHFVCDENDSDSENLVDLLPETSLCATLVLLCFFFCFCLLHICYKSHDKIVLGFCKKGIQL